jgi:hypothetical protein
VRDITEGIQWLWSKPNLPHSKITVEIPAIQFVMNVEPKLPFGSGVKPHTKSFNNKAIFEWRKY